MKINKALPALGLSLWFLPVYAFRAIASEPPSSSQREKQQPSRPTTESDISTQPNLTVIPSESSREINRRVIPVLEFKPQPSFTQTDKIRPLLLQHITEALPTVEIAQQASNSVVGEEGAMEEDADEVRESVGETEGNLTHYLVPPYRMDPNSLSPNGTRFRFNSQVLDHLTTTQLRTGYQLSNDINGEPTLRGTIKLDSYLQRSVTDDHLVTVEHRGDYFQAELIRQAREVVVNRYFPETISGFGIQLSITGACLFQDSTTQERCSYTPSLGTVEVDDIADLRDAGRLEIAGEVGEVLTRDSIEAIQQPGFQRGVNGQTIGIDLLFPNTGTRSGNRVTETTTADRQETIRKAPTLTLARARQIVKINAREAALGVTLRGNTWIDADENTWSNSLLQAGAALLPDIDPHLAGTGESANSQVNRNLFLAANNIRLPPSSFTLYYGGIGRADSIFTETQGIPPARFKGVWLGLSPVVDYQIRNQASPETVGSLRTVRRIGTEGGRDGDSGLQLLSLTNNNEFITDDIRDTYVQLYQSLYETDSQTVAIENYREETTYYPHISFTGNITSFDQVFNYYTGAIIEDSINAYVGADYTAFSAKGLTYKVGGIFYTQADRDYYSQLQSSVTQRVQLSGQTSLALSGGLNWAIDREDQIGDVEVNSRSNSVYVRADAQLGPLSLGVTENIVGVLPNSVPASTRVQASLNLTETLNLSGFITPFSRSGSYARYGVSLNWQLLGYDSPLLRLGWTQNRYSFGTDLFGQSILTNEDLFSLSLQL